MTFLELKTDAARVLNLLDSTGEFLTGKDITEAQLGDSVNDGYLEEAFPALVNQYPMYFEQKAYMANYTVTGTASAGLTGTTLQTTTAIFTANMRDCYIYNSTDSTSTQIMSYTDTTHVVVADDVSSWSGDAIKILDKDFSFGGAASLFYGLKFISVRYNTALNLWTTCSMRTNNDVFQSGYETFGQTYPACILETLKITSIPTDGFRIYPYFAVPDTNAIELTYVKHPTALSGDGDEPRLPRGNHHFLFWHAVIEGAAQRGDLTLSAYANKQFEDGKRELLQSFRPTVLNQPMIPQIPRRYIDSFRRYI